MISPRAMIKEDNLEFSFSGLKSAFINLHHNADQREKACPQRFKATAVLIFSWQKPRRLWRNTLLKPLSWQVVWQPIKVSENA